jgi:ABC-type bacteriocin/lantibiotic exporter with double-glycine peptidase domain
VLQIEPVECGAACLAMILAHHGQHVPLDRLRVECGVSRDGSNAMNIILAARDRGLDAAGYRMDLAGFAETALPFIVFWEYNHFVVVEGFSHDRVHIVDPSFGRRTIDLASAASSYSGVVLDFQPSPQFKRLGRAPRSFARLPAVFRGSEHILLQSVWACAAATVPILVGAAIVRLVVDSGVPQGDLTSILPLAIILAVAGSARAASKAPSMPGR